MDVVRRDSIGIAIVESTTPQWRGVERWAVDPQPVLDLSESGQGAPHEFFRVQDAIRLADSSYAVADRGSNEIRLFSSVGRFVRAIGGSGEGPGEFGRLTSIARHDGDSLVAYDHWLRRITMFDLATHGTRTFSPYRPNVRLWRIHPLDDELLVGVIDDWSPGSTSGMYRGQFTVVSITWSGEVRDTVGTVPGNESFLFDRGSANPLFVKTGHVAVYDGRIYVGSADSLEYRVYSAVGRLEQIIRVPGFDLQLTEEDIRVERAARAAVSPPGLPRWYWEVLESLPAPATRPAYSALQIDGEGFVWLARHHGVSEADKPAAWMVFSPDGSWLGSVDLPSRFTVYEIGSDYILGKRKDQLDVEHVEVLRLRRL